MITWLQEWLKQRRIRDAEIDPNSKCPGCGHRNGKLKCDLVERKEKPNTTAMIQHVCQICGATWHEPTIVKPELWVPAELLMDKG
jgi:hypothetical protein